jgi:hypothetical protein
MILYLAIGCPRGANKGRIIGEITENQFFKHWGNCNVVQKSSRENKEPCRRAEMLKALRRFKNRCPIWGILIYFDSVFIQMKRCWAT